LSKETDGMTWQSSTYCFIYLFLSNTGKVLNYMVIASQSSLLAEKMEEKWEEKTHLSLMKKKVGITTKQKQNKKKKKKFEKSC
jgi:hypothetical protein